MIDRLILISGFVVCLAAGASWASPAVDSRPDGLTISDGLGALLTQPLRQSFTASGTDVFQTESAYFTDGRQPSLDVYSFDVKSTKKAFLYSFILPGAGEYYAGSRIKPWVFLGLEGLFWTGHIYYHGLGKDKENEFKAFADGHYDRVKYDEWWATVPPDSQEVYSHRLPDEKNWEYYENIGKYEQFKIGWDDLANRETYLNMRKDSNDLFSRARTSLILVLANHVISGFDAAFTARSYNKKNERFSSYHLEAKPLTGLDGTPIPGLVLTKSF